MVSIDDEGAAAARLAVRVLRAGSAEGIPFQASPPARCLLDYRALRRWHIPESVVPDDCEIRFLPRAIWRDYPRQFGASMAAIVGARRARGGASRATPAAAPGRPRGAESAHDAVPRGATGRGRRADRLHRPRDQPAARRDPHERRYRPIDHRAGSDANRGHPANSRRHPCGRPPGGRGHPAHPGARHQARSRARARRHQRRRGRGSRDVAQRSRPAQYHPRSFRSIRRHPTCWPIAFNCSRSC